MKTLSAWAQSFDVNRKPWLMLGKGPTFEKFKSVQADDFHILTLNHVIRECRATLAHAIDLDVVIECAESFLNNADYVVLPWRPHVKFAPGQATLADFVETVPVLKQLSQQGRLVYYNIESTEKLGYNKDAPIIRVVYFSAEGGLGVLAWAGARTVRSLGVDGGNAYGRTFDDLASTTRLANGHANFNRQFEMIAQTIRRTGVFYAPLCVEAPVRVFVGADPTQRLAYKVLDYSIKRHASVSVEICMIDNEGVPIPADPDRRARTGFSFGRLKIPSLCGYEGRAIYMDADMQVFTDILDLWSNDFGEADILYAEHASEDGRIPQYSVLLLNAAALNWDATDLVNRLDRGEFTYSDLMHRFAFMDSSKVRPGLPEAWNSLEHYEDGVTKLLHFTDMPRQPWVTNKNPNAPIWYADLKRGLEEGFIPKDLLYDEIDRGHVAPQLTRWIGLPDPKNLSALKARFVPQHERIARKNAASTAAAGGARRARGKLGKLLTRMWPQ